MDKIRDHYREQMIEMFHVLLIVHDDHMLEVLVRD